MKHSQANQRFSPHLSVPRKSLFITTHHLFDTSSGHSLEASLVSLVDLWHLILVLSKLVDKLGSVQLAVGTSGLDNLGLLLEGEVLPGEVWSDVLLEESKNLVVRDGSRVGEVVDTGLLVLGQDDGGWEEIVEDGVGVWDIDDSVVLGNLGDKVAGVEVVADGHAKTEDKSVGVVFHDLEICQYLERSEKEATNLLNVCLGL